MAEVLEQLQVNGTAFFPVGRGLWNDHDTTLSTKKVMVLGQDFGTVADMVGKVLPHGKEDVKGNPTWRNLLSLLERAGIEQEDCFYTNAIMGLRQTGKNTDTPTAFKHPEFMKGCRVFFLEQLKIQRPSLVLVLGFRPVEFLRHGLSSHLSKRWAVAKSITQMLADESQSVARGVQFEDIPDFSTNVVVLFHPSLRGVNIAKLSKREATNFDAHTEVNRIQSAYSSK